MIKPHILVLAAGRGKRMQSEAPKVLHPVLFRPIIHYVLDFARALPHSSLSMVVGYQHPQVISHCHAYEGLNYFIQENLAGTADAIRTAEGFLKDKTGQLLVLSGDVMLLTGRSLERLLAVHSAEKAALTVLTAEVEAPGTLGRVLRDSHGKLLGIRESVDCSESERELNEINVGVYCFELDILFKTLDQIKPSNQQKEYYLTDTIGILIAQNQKVVAVPLDDPTEALGINTRRDLADVETLLQMRVNDELMLNGVNLQCPETIFIDPTSKIEPDVRIEAGCTIIGSSVARGTLIESYSRVIDSVIAKDCYIKQGSYILGSEVGDKSSVGPYANLRPGTRLKEKVKIGNFVELKNSVLEDGVKAAHLSYIGDAEVGRNVNIGCGFITCNFDGGPEKHRTIIEDDVFIGSDSQVVAPVKLGKGSYIASGTTVTEDVPPDTLALSRGRQVNKPGFSKQPKKDAGC